jgi:hypothetical protein
MLAAGVLYMDNTSTEGKLSMTIFSDFGAQGSGRPFFNARPRVLADLVCIHTVTIDLRWALVELALRSITAACAFAYARSAVRVRRIIRRGRSCGGPGFTAADTMVAAGGR